MMAVVFSVAFFGVAFALALRPGLLSRVLGRFSAPALILLIVLVVGASVLGGAGEPAAPHAPYAESAVSHGFLTGYQTMDTIAALNFGIVIVMNIRALGVTEEKAVLRSTVRAGGVAAVLFLSVYSMLAHIGALSGGAFPGTTNGAATMTNLVGAIFGPWGRAILAAVFVIACFNTCVGLLSSCSTYFHTLLPRFPASAWAAFFALLSMVIANAGLDQILEFSVPVLNILYPPAIVLILLSFLPERLQRLRAIYPAGILFTGAASILYTVQGLGAAVPVLDGVLSAVPLAEVGLGWVLPALAGVLLGAVLSLQRESKEVR